MTRTGASTGLGSDGFLGAVIDLVREQAAAEEEARWRRRQRMRMIALYAISIGNGLAWGVLLVAIR